MRGRLVPDSGLQVPYWRPAEHAANANKLRTRILHSAFQTTTYPTPSDSTTGVTRTDALRSYVTHGARRVSLSRPVPHHTAATTNAYANVASNNSVSPDPSGHVATIAGCRSNTTGTAPIAAPAEPATALIGADVFKSGSTIRSSAKPIGSVPVDIPNHTIMCSKRDSPNALGETTKQSRRVRSPPTVVSTTIGAQLLANTDI